jgi:hypothetical protein
MNDKYTVNLEKSSAKFDPTAIRTHFSHLHHAAGRASVPGGKLCLAVYGENPDTGERVTSVQHFTVGDHEGMTNAAMQFEGMPHHNVYAPLVIFKPDIEPGTRAEKDISAVFGFVIDGDADKGKDAPTSPLPADCIVESSTGNLQHFLFLDRPLPPDEAKAFGNAIKRATGADSANDIGHVWRVPGALNWPNASKLKRGRSREPQPVTVKRPWDKWTSVGELRATLAPHWKEPRAERTEANPDAPKFDYDRVSRWIDRKLNGDWELSQEDWALFGKALKVSFPNEDGLALWLRMSHDPDKAEKRWNNPHDFKPEYVEGMRTLKWYFDKDPIGWMFGDVSDIMSGKLVQSPGIVPGPLPDGMPLPGPWQGEEDDEAPESTKLPPSIIQSSADFIAGFVPPDYVVDGIFQRRYFYSLTAATGVGKTSIAMRVSAHVHLGRKLAGVDVFSGTVIYLCGENPDDVRMRWLGMTQTMGFDPSNSNVHFVPHRGPIEEIANRVRAEAIQKSLQPSLVVVDTSAAYNDGDDENSNAQMVAHARRTRTLTELPGGPCVISCCHPTKNASDDNLIPRGGGGFIAEVDGNVRARRVDDLVAIDAHGKFRGPEFPPISFQLNKVFHPRLVDSRGRPIPTVVAQPVEESAREKMEATSRDKGKEVLLAVYNRPNSNPTDLAKALGWNMRNGSPYHVKVSRILTALAKAKLVREHLSGWQVTEKGGKELNELEREQT